MTETTTPVEETSSSSVQAGDLTAKLAACREKAGVDVEQAADEMHLSVNLLRALEQEDFAHLPEPPYVRGYLRGYAKLAGMDPSELIRTYEALRGANPDEVAHYFAPSRSLGKVTEPVISPGIIKLIGIALLAGIIALIAMIPGVRDWASSTWASLAVQTAPPQVERPAPALQTFTAAKDAEEKATTSSTAQDTSTTSPADASMAKPAEPTAAQAPAASTVADNKPAAADTQAAAQSADKATDAGSSDKTSTIQAAKTAATDANAKGDDKTDNKPADTAADKATASAITTAATPATETTSTTDQAAAPGADTTTATTPQPIGGEVTVKLEFGEEVWMQVKNDDKKVLFESLNSSGTTKEFKATTPLNFKIGNAHGVKVYLNGQLYDQAAHTKGSVARFKVE